MVTDHNITIYYHSKDGGGSFRLFRKVGDKSGERSTESKVRKDGSYIYEEFIDTKVIDFLKRKRELFKKGLKKKKKKNSEDVKVYTVGAYYAYAESRKSPISMPKNDRYSPQLHFAWNLLYIRQTLRKHCSLENLSQNTSHVIVVLWIAFDERPAIYVTNIRLQITV